MATKIAKSKKIQYWGTGRRKKSIARVRVLPNGNGSITINGRDIDNYFNLDTLKYIVRQPLVLTDTQTKYDVAVNVHGGGFTGQAGAIRHGISRALVLAGEDKDKIKKAGFLTRDPRMKERKSTDCTRREKRRSSPRDNCCFPCTDFKIQTAVFVCENGGFFRSINKGGNKI